MKTKYTENKRLMVHLFIKKEPNPKVQLQWFGTIRVSHSANIKWRNQCPNHPEAPNIGKKFAYTVATNLDIHNFGIKSCCRIERCLKINLRKILRKFESVFVSSEQMKSCNCSAVSFGVEPTKSEWNSFVLLPAEYNNK